MALLTLAAIVGAAAVICINQSGETSDEKNMQKTEHTPPPSTAVTTSQPASLSELLSLSGKELTQVDLAVMNLLCAEGLPGAENLDVAVCSALLDQWAERVRRETDRHLYQFRRTPQEFENSEGFFRILTLNTVLQLDFGVHYNMARMRNVDFRNAKDIFIHGMIADPNGGTCASMPVLVAAVSRRLGYPVRLVTTKAHVFCRWDAPGDRINLEVSATGLNTYPDSYYKKWPIPSTEAEIKANNFLVSLSPKEELAGFLENRGHCLTDHNRLTEAQAAFAQAEKLCPEMKKYKFYAKTTKAQTPRRAKVAKLYSPVDIERINRDNARMLQSFSQPPPTPRPVSTPVYPPNSFRAKQQAKRNLHQHSQ